MRFRTCGNLRYRVPKNGLLRSYPCLPLLLPALAELKPETTLERWRDTVRQCRSVSDKRIVTSTDHSNCQRVTVAVSLTGLYGGDDAGHKQEDHQREDQNKTNKYQA